jgi:Protein of unknown function (DUF1573)
MDYRILLLLSLCFTSSSHTDALEVDKARKIVFAKLTDKSLQVSFQFTNTESYPVIINTVKTGCGCTKVTPATYKLFPGDSTKAEMDVTLSGKNGAFLVDALIITDDKKTTRIEAFVDMPSIGKFIPNPLIIPLKKSGATSVSLEHGDISKIKTVEIVSCPKGLAAELGSFNSEGVTLNFLKRNSVVVEGHVIVKITDSMLNIKEISLMVKTDLTPQAELF